MWGMLPPPIFQPIYQYFTTNKCIFDPSCTRTRTHACGPLRGLRAYAHAYARTRALISSSSTKTSLRFLIFADTSEEKMEGGLKPPPIFSSSASLRWKNLRQRGNSKKGLRPLFLNCPSYRVSKIPNNCEIIGNFLLCKKNSQ